MQLFITILPILGLFMTAILAMLLGGTKGKAVLFLGPALTYLTIVFFQKFIGEYNFLFGMLFMVFCTILFIYYPILLIYTIYMHKKGRVSNAQDPIKKI